MIELTEEIVNEAMKRAKIDQDKIIQKAKEIYGPKETGTRSVED